VDYTTNSNKRIKLDDILGNYNLKSVITFPTRIGSMSYRIDNIFFDDQKISDYEISSCTNGLSDHEAQLLTIQISPHLTTVTNIPLGRILNDYNMADFKLKLSYEGWEIVFNSDHVNTSFNNFLNSLLRHLYASFPLKKKGEFISKNLGLQMVLERPAETNDCCTWN
jgi:hypothetical protein